MDSYLEELKGGVITDIAREPEGSYPRCEGLMITKANGEKVIAWMQSDAEGNDEGFLSIEANPEAEVTEDAG